jgi:IS605 OrfB family transposase
MTKTFSNWIYLTPKMRHVYSSMTHEAKNIFNHFLFCNKLFNEHKSQLYISLNTIDTSKIELKNKKVKQEVGIDSNATEYIINSLCDIYKNVIEKSEQIKINNTLIFDYITKDNPYVYNHNYNELVVFYCKKCKKLDGIRLDVDHCDILLTNIVKNILKSRYFRNYYKVRQEMYEHKKITVDDMEFIEHVKSKKTIFLVKKPSNIKSERNILRRFALSVYTTGKLPRDIVMNIMDKVYSALSSNMALRKKGIKTGNIKFLPKDSHYSVLFYTHCFKVQNNKIRLSIGDKIMEQFNLEDKFLYIKKPKKLDGEQIVMLELCPKYDGTMFKVNIVYNENAGEIYQNVSTKVNDMISIDTGIINLMTIYNPTGTQKIIKGSYLSTPNFYYNKKIDEMKSRLKIDNDKNTSQPIRRLLRKRENMLNYRMNKIVAKIYEVYHDKKKIVIGYNKGWKSNVEMGKKNNRKFYEIPYTRMIKKLKNKFGDERIEIQQEAYTSKCDSLNLEEVCRHEKYDGERIKRGLYASSIHKLINADVNGAINIMRLYCRREGIEFNKIGGVRICNPSKLKI